jgi:hypothetical protein
LTHTPRNASPRRRRPPAGPGRRFRPRRRADAQEGAGQQDEGEADWSGVDEERAGEEGCPAAASNIAADAGEPEKRSTAARKNIAPVRARATTAEEPPERIGRANGALPM